MVWHSLQDKNSCRAEWEEKPGSDSGPAEGSTARRGVRRSQGVRQRGVPGQTAAEGQSRADPCFDAFHLPDFPDKHIKAPALHVCSSASDTKCNFFTRRSISELFSQPTIAVLFDSSPGSSIPARQPVTRQPRRCGVLWRGRAATFAGCRCRCQCRRNGRGLRSAAVARASSTRVQFSVTPFFRVDVLLSQRFYCRSRRPYHL